jgi:hypothetical protein
MHLAKEQSRQRIKEIRALWHEWDPIGVYTDSEDDWPLDEYDNYLGPCLRLLEQQAPTEDLAKYLSHIVGEHMGLGEAGLDYSQPAEFARKLQAWYTTAWPGTHV